MDFLDNEGLEAFWLVLDKQNTEVIEKIKELIKEIRELKEKTEQLENKIVHKELTREEYDALSEEDKMKDIEYFVNE